MSDEITTKVDLIEDGLLWAINTTVFHPRALALQYDTETKGFSLMGDGKEAWVFLDDLTQVKHAAFEAAITRHVAATRPVEEVQSEERLKAISEVYAEHEISGSGWYCSCSPRNEESGTVEPLDEYPERHIGRAILVRLTEKGLLG